MAVDRPFPSFVSKFQSSNRVQRHAGFAVNLPPKFASIREIRVKVLVLKTGWRGGEAVSGKELGRKSPLAGEFELIRIACDEQIRIDLLQEGDVQDIGASHSQGDGVCGAQLLAFSNRIGQVGVHPRKIPALVPAFEQPPNAFDHNFVGAVAGEA